MTVLNWRIASATVLAFAVFASQIGALGQEHYNSDEFTFMILASDILDGQMPYIERFDNKPPGIFIMFAGAMAVFGENLWAIRVFGDVMLWLIGMMVYVIAAPRFGSWPALAGALATVMIHAVPPGLFTSAGLPAMAVTLIALWAVIQHPRKAWAFALAGAMISIATLTRTNLAYLAVGVGLWLGVCGLIWPRPALLRWAVIPYTIGGLLPLAIIVLIYAGIGEFDAFRLATVDVALSYSNGWGALGAIKVHLLRWGQHVADKPLTYGTFTLLMMFALCAQCMRSKEYSVAHRHYTWALWVFALSIAYSVLKSGAVYSYYWQQLFPFVGLLVAEALWRVASYRTLRIGGGAVVGLLTLSALLVSVPETVRVLTQPGYIAARYTIRAATDQLAEVLQPTDRVWALERHLAIWYLDVPTVSKVVTHPSNIYREAIITPLAQAGYVPEDELDQLYASRPEYLITNKAGYVFYVDLFGKDHARLDAYLAEHYTRFIEGDHPDILHDDIAIWRRNDLVSEGS